MNSSVTAQCAILCFNTLLEDGSLLSKDVGIGT